MITHLNHIQSPCNVIQTSLESSSLSLSPIQQPTLQCPIFLSKKQHAFYTHTKQHHLPSTILYDTILTLRAGNYNRNSNNCYADRGGNSNSSTNSKNNSNSSSSSSSSTQDDNFHEHNMNMSNDDQSNNGDWICPNCDTKFGRDSMIHGKPAIKLVGGKTQMTKK